MIERISHTDGIVELRLNRPPVNALNPRLVSELDQALAAAESGGASGVVLSGHPGLFSAGLDVPALLQLDERRMRAFWTDFFGLLERLARSQLMTCAALTGHSPAGGTVLALFCDYRVLAKGDYRLGLNEVEVGLVVPPVIHKALARLIGPYRAERHLLAGRMISTDEALAVGLVDEMVILSDVVDRSVRWLQSSLDMPAHALRQTRALCRADLAALFDAPEGLDIDSFVQGWFDPATQASLKELADRLSKD